MIRSMRSTPRNFAATSVEGRTGARWKCGKISLTAEERMFRTAASIVSPASRTGVGFPRKMKTPSKHAFSMAAATRSRLRSAARLSARRYWATTWSAIRSSTSPSIFSERTISGSSSSTVSSFFTSRTTVFFSST